MRRRVTFLCALLLSAGSLTSGCNLDNPGDDPPKGLIYLPTGMLLSAASEDSAPSFLYVVNSNFDLRYNAGSLQAFDLAKLDEAVAGCDQQDAIHCEIEPNDVLADEIIVPSLATYLAASEEHTRLYVTTRTETNIVWIDVDESGSDVLRCNDHDRHCSAQHSQYEDPLAADRDLEVPREAVGMISARAGAFVPTADPPLEGELVLVAHRAGQVSLFQDRLDDSPLLLLDVLTLHAGTEVLQEPTGISFDPTTQLAYVSIYARESVHLQDKKLLGRIGIAPTEKEGVPALLYDADALSLEGVSLGRDTRAVEINPAVPGEALVVSRVPNSLLWVNVSDARDGTGLPTQAVVRQTTAVGRGPSRVITGKFGDRTLAIVSCFDSRQIFILDANTGDVLSIVQNFSGPFELALDEPRRRLYVADFRSSAVRVLDLAPLMEGATETMPTARIIATLGHPRLLQELQ